MDDGELKEGKSDNQNMQLKIFNGINNWYEINR